jgi:transcriptional regulator with XRE-family HTH domain
MAKTRKTKDFNIDRHIGRCIRYYRTLRGLTQSDLALQLHITFQQLQKYEKGASSTSSASLLKISKILKCNVYDFLPDFKSENSDKSFAAEGIRDVMSNPFFSEDSTSSFTEKDLRHLVVLLRNLGEDQRAMVESFVETLVKKKRKSSNDE